MQQYRFLPLYVGVAALAFTGQAHAVDFKPIDVTQRSASIIQVADNTEGAKSFIDNMAQKGIGFLAAENLTQEQRIKEFRSLLNNSFDMETIGRFALGRYWKAATPQQQAEYQKLFKQMVVDVYSRRFNDYKGEKLEVRSARPDGDSDVLVTSSIIPANGDEIQVDWRVRNKGGQNKIVDVVIAGVSMAQTQRSDFSSVIQRGGGDLNVLLEHLRSGGKAE